MTKDLAAAVELVKILEPQIREELEWVIEESKLQGKPICGTVSCEVNELKALLAVTAALMEADKRVEAMSEMCEAARKLSETKYIQWTEAGGSSECKHGYSAGVPCRDCDWEVLDKALAALRSLESAQQEGGK